MRNGGKVNNKQNGITLVALVITIIMLLILSGITINGIAGNNGIINMSKWAAFSQEMSEINENVDIKKIRNTKELLEGNEGEMFQEMVISKDLDKTLKMEILYIREYMPEDKKPTKEYYYEDLLDYLTNEDGTVKGLYYIDQETAGEKYKYIYDEITETVYRVKGMKIWGEVMHSYEYGCKVANEHGASGNPKEKTADYKDYVIGSEAEIVEINGIKHYAPNLKGYNGLTTSAVYYSDDSKETKEVSISLHMNNKVVNKIEENNKTYTWYDYENKKWANIKTTANNLEAWWVWIPRYAYKLNPKGTEKAGSIDIIYIDINNKPLSKPEGSTEIPETLPEGYVVHPSFTQEGKGEIKGIWISKYPPSYGKETADDLEMDSTALKPNLEGFDKENTYLVKYNNNTADEGTKLGSLTEEQLSKFNEEKTWYDYENKKWANIKTVANGLESWWVWIPRYAYKLPDTENDDTEIIFVGLDNKPLNKEKFGENIPEGYVVHPSFTQEEKGELEGIWMSKYPPSYVKETENDLEMDSTILEPNLEGFDKENTYLVKYNNNTADEGTKLGSLTEEQLSKFNEEKTWYDYENKKWANIKTVANGLESWWVWIPRYAYKLPDTENDDTEIIFVGLDNKPLNKEKFGETLPEGYKVHPSFTQEGKDELKGIWVSKYPPSKN